QSAGRRPVGGVRDAVVALVVVAGRAGGARRGSHGARPVQVLAVRPQLLHNPAARAVRRQGRVRVPRLPVLDALVHCRAEARGVQRPPALVQLSTI
ncbi:hypothetical protein LPJ70_000885, partial [Coemansia sp. RSA 2708]